MADSLDRTNGTKPRFVDKLTAGICFLELVLEVKILKSSCQVVE